jgi:hypothetical protein
LYHATDQKIAGIFSLENPGGIIILEVNLNDYSMSEIARIRIEK